MNWRRGILLAGINLAVAAPLMIWFEAGYWPLIRTNVNTLTDLEKEQIKEDGYPFNPCYGGRFCWPVNPEIQLVAPMDNLPVALLTGWHSPCEPQSRIDAVVESLLGRTRRSEIVTTSILCAGVSIEWLMVGGFPLVRFRRRWLEPGALVTSCTLVGMLLVVIPYAHPLARLPLCCVLCAWFWWFGLLIWKTSRALWRIVSRTPAPAS